MSLGQPVTVPFANPQNVSVGQVFTAAVFIADVPPNVYPFECDNSGSDTAMIAIPMERVIRSVA